MLNILAFLTANQPGLQDGPGHQTEEQRGHLPSPQEGLQEGPSHGARRY